MTPAYAPANCALLTSTTSTRRRDGVPPEPDSERLPPPPATLELATDTVRLLRRYLRDRWKDTDALFPTRSSDRITTRSLQRVIEKLAVEANVRPLLANGGTGGSTDVTPHTLRHSVSYRIIQVDGGRLEDVQLRLRHANRQTTDQIYSHLIPR